MRARWSMILATLAVACREAPRGAPPVDVLSEPTAFFDGSGPDLPDARPPDIDAEGPRDVAPKDDRLNDAAQDRDADALPDVDAPRDSAPDAPADAPPDVSSGGDLELGGTASLDAVDPTGQEAFRVSLRLRNAGASTLTLRRALILLANRGGFAFSLGDPLATTGTFFGAGPALAPRPTAATLALSYAWSTPVSRFVAVLDATDRAGAPLRAVAEVPVARAGYATPTDSMSFGEVAVALQEPLEVVELASGQRWLSIVGQVVNTTASPLTLTRWRMRLAERGGGTTFDRDLRSTFPVRGATDALLPFLYGFALPGSFTAGALTVEAGATLGASGERVATREVPVALRTATVVAAPVQGQWTWGNGPGELVYHTHFRYPEQRYAYDLVVRRDVGGARATHAGDPTRNASYFCYGQPVRAVAAGTVLEVVDDVPENSGSRENPANSPRRNSRIAVRHADGRVALYVHVQQGSARVRVGQAVAAGQQIAAVGNAGFSTEPHLHFALYELDSTGRAQAVPVAIAGLRSVAGMPLSGVPVGQTEYVTD